MGRPVREGGGSRAFQNAAQLRHPVEELEEDFPIMILEMDSRSAQVNKCQREPRQQSVPVGPGLCLDGRLTGMMNQA